MAHVSFHAALDSFEGFARRALIRKEYKSFLQDWDFVIEQFGGPEILFAGSTPAKLVLLGAPIDVDSDRLNSPPNKGLARFFASDVGRSKGKPGNEVSFGVGSFDEEFYEQLWELFEKGGAQDTVVWNIGIRCSSIVGEEVFNGFVSLTRTGLEWSLKKDADETETPEKSPAPKRKRSKSAETGRTAAEADDVDLLEIIRQLEAGDQAEFEGTSPAKRSAAKKKKK